MVSILPPQRHQFSALIDSMKQFGQHAPQLLEERFKTQRGLDQLEKAQQAISEGIVDPVTKMRRDLDPHEMALQYAKAGVASGSGLERALGPLMQTAMQGQKVNRAFPESGQVQGQPKQIPGDQGQTPGMQPQQQPQEPFKGALPVGQPGFMTPGPFNIPTPQEIKQEGERYARAVNDPNAAVMREDQLRRESDTANQQRADLENAALNTKEVTPAELPRFMQVGAQFDTRNPSQWLQNTQRAYATVKANDKKIQTAFYPGIGQALMGQNRDAALERLVPTSLEQKALGLEEDTRKYYADQYMSPVEIEAQFRPLTPPKAKEIEKFPKGLFPHENETTFERGFPEGKKRSTISYEEALEKAPKELELMKNQLADFFLKNVDDDTSLSVLSNKIWQDKDYDWRQIGPAIREAQKKGLKLSGRQSTELTDLETNPPIQSLPDIFRDLSRIPAYLRGNK